MIASAMFLTRFRPWRAVLLLVRGAILLALGNAAIAADEPAGRYTNPLIDATLADPCVIFHDGLYYLYATGDVDGDNGYRAYTSPDLVRWRRGPVVFRPARPTSAGAGCLARFGLGAVLPLLHGQRGDRRG